MKLKEDLILRCIAGEHVVIPIGNNVATFNGIISLNDTACFLWQKVQSQVSREELVTSLLDEYEVDEDQAGKDIDDFFILLREHEPLIED
jgi:hypothetical protein